MKVLIADDHPLFRAGLKHVLAQLGDGVIIVEADDHAAALDAASAHADLALLLLDLRMPGGPGIAALRALVKRFPALPIVVLSASEDRAEMQQAFDCGAVGFIQKSTPAAVMLGALRLVLDGGIYVPPTFVQSNDRVAAAATSELTQRQSDVLARVLDGKSNKAIATELGLTEATVKAHITAVFKALKVSNRTQAAMLMSKRDLRKD